MSKDIVPNGCWPVMLTPFSTDRSFDWEGVDALIDYYVEAGVAGIFTVCLSSEIFQMSSAERLELARRVVARADGRVRVIASAVADAEPANQAEAVKAMAGTGVDAVVLLPGLLAAPGEADAVWRGRLERILTLTDDVPLGFYECPRPYKRGVSPEDLGWAARTGRFLFHKDTCHDLALVKRKLAAIQGTGLKFFATQMGTLVDTLEAGGHGFSSYAANLYPELVQWLATRYGADATKARRVQNLLALAEHAIGPKYPASAKYFVARNAGLPIGTACRATYDELSRHDELPLLALMEHVKSLDLPVRVIEMAGR